MRYEFGSPYPLIIASAALFLFSVIYGAVYFVWVIIEPVARDGTSLGPALSGIDAVDIFVFPVMPLAMIGTALFYVWIQAYKDSISGGI